jgi:radical SAM protein with 4Fe4S-binding SPASM domain
VDNKKLLDYSISMAPLRVEFELTEECNLHCSFCYNSQTPQFSHKATKIIDKLCSENVPEIVLTGGEPMLHPDFSALFKSCSIQFEKVMVQTNGTFITPDIIQMFKEHKVFAVNVSFHGDKIHHEKLTGVKGSYEKALDAIRLSVDEGLNISSNFVLTTENVACLDDTISLLYSIGLRQITLTRFTPTGIGAGNSNLQLTREQLIKALYTAKQKMDEFPDLNIIAANSIPYCALPNDLNFFSSYCHFGASRFYIDINGNVLMCGMSRIKIGSILENNFKEIKNMSKEFAEHILGTDVPRQCKSCPDFSYCRGGCRAAALALSKNFQGRDPYMKEI